MDFQTPQPFSLQIHTMNGPISVLASVQTEISILSILDCMVQRKEEPWYGVMNTLALVQSMEPGSVLENWLWLIKIVEEIGRALKLHSSSIWIRSFRRDLKLLRCGNHRI